MRVDTLCVGEIQENCYIVSSDATHNAILIDPGDECPKIKAFLQKKKLTAKIIAHTHGHIDHIQADNEFNLPVYVHALDVELLKNPDKNLSSFLSHPFKVDGQIKPVQDSDTIILDEIILKVLFTPGHTPGGICLACGAIVFTGDTLFAGSVGRTDFPGASHEQLIKSIREKLLVLPDATIIYPGHGPHSTIGKERKANPFLTHSEGGSCGVSR